MSDSGFPPFRSAQPKKQVMVAPSIGQIEAENDAPLSEAERRVLETPQPMRTAEVQTHNVLSGTIEHITVCAKCGSREVREAVLIGDEVYVKLG